MLKKETKQDLEKARKHGENNYRNISLDNLGHELEFKGEYLGGDLFEEDLGDILLPASQLSLCLRRGGGKYLLFLGHSINPDIRADIGICIGEYTSPAEAFANMSGYTFAWMQDHNYR